MFVAVLSCQTNRHNERSLPNTRRNKTLHNPLNHGGNYNYRGPGSVVGIVPAYGLDGPGIESRWGEIFRTSPDRP